MSSYNPPDYYFNGIYYNPSFYQSSSNSITQEYADSNYLKRVGYPISMASNTIFTGSIDVQGITGQNGYFENVSVHAVTGQNAYINAISVQGITGQTGYFNYLNIQGITGQTGYFANLQTITQANSDNSNNVSTTSFIKNQNYTTLSQVQSNSNTFTNTNIFNNGIQCSSDITMTSIGKYALYGNTGASDDIAIGYNAMGTANNSYQNVVIGNRAMPNSGTVTYSVIIGNDAMKNYNTSNNNNGSGNVCVGYNSAGNLKNGSQNVFLGNGCGSAVTSGVNNLIVGNAMNFLASGSVGSGIDNNVVVGNYCMQFVKDNTQANIALGPYALYSENGFGGVYCTAIGPNAGVRSLGSYNTFIGLNASVYPINSYYNNSTAIGYNATITNSNQIVIGTSSETTCIYGLTGNTAFFNTLTSPSYNGNGSGLTSLNGSNISSGTVSDTRLSSNVVFKNVVNNFTPASGTSAISVYKFGTSEYIFLNSSGDIGYWNGTINIWTISSAGLLTVRGGISSTVSSNTLSSLTCASITQTGFSTNPTTLTISQSGIYVYYNANTTLTLPDISTTNGIIYNIMVDAVILTLNAFSATQKFYCAYYYNASGTLSNTLTINVPTSFSIISNGGNWYLYNTNMNMARLNMANTFGNTQTMSSGLTVSGTTTLNGTTNINNVSNVSNTNMRFYNTTYSATNYKQLFLDNSGSFCVYNQASTGSFLGPTATSWSANSDIRIKRNIFEVEPSLDKLMNIQPIYFNYTDDVDNEQPRVGFIAQNVQTQFPNIVCKGAYNETLNDNILGLSQTELIPYLVKAIQEQQKQIINLQNIISKLNI